MNISGYGTLFSMVTTQPFHTIEEARKIVETWKQAGEIVVFTNGCFDLMHAGHVSYLEEARSLGDRLVVGMNSDASVRAIKGPLRPIVNEQDRARVLAGLKAVDLVVVFHDSTPVETLRQLQPQIHTKGGDYIPENMPEYPVVQSYGGTVKLLSFVDGCSTSNIIEKIITVYHKES